MLIYNLDGTITISAEGQSMTFENIYWLMDALSEWQRELVFDMMKIDILPDEAWKAFAEACRN